MFFNETSNKEDNFFQIIMAFSKYLNFMALFFKVS